MTIETAVAAHYTTGALIDRIRDALAALGVDPERPSPEDLKPVDEFHIGGVAATSELLGQIAIGRDAEVLDIGSGLGGTPRYIAGATGARVTGLDLTPEFVETATALSEMVGMAGRTRFTVGSALDMPFAPDSFDAATLIHVGMNIPDKPRLMAEAARVLRPGSPLAIYEVMRIAPGEIAFPVPWAQTPATSFLGRIEDYRAAAESAGFRVVAMRERRAFALDFFAAMQARLAEAGPPPLGLHLLMPTSRVEKIANMIANIEAGRIAPVEMILRAP